MLRRGIAALLLGWWSGLWAMAVLDTKSELVVKKGPAVALKILSLKAIKISERNNDELYIGVTAYPSNDKPVYYQVPPFPSYWLSSHLNKIHNVDLWRGHIENGQSVSLVISLIEHDTPPWDSDDLIETINIRVQNEGGQLNAYWKKKNHKNSSKEMITLKGLSKKFNLKGDGAEYILELVLKGPLKDKVKGKNLSAADAEQLKREQEGKLKLYALPE